MGTDSVDWELVIMEPEGVFKATEFVESVRVPNKRLTLYFDTSLDRKDFDFLRLAVNAFAQDKGFADRLRVTLSADGKSVLISGLNLNITESSQLSWWVDNIFTRMSCSEVRERIWEVFKGSFEKLKGAFVDWGMGGVVLDKSGSLSDGWFRKE